MTSPSFRAFGVWHYPGAWGASGCGYAPAILVLAVVVGCGSPEGRRAQEGIVCASCTAELVEVGRISDRELPGALPERMAFVSRRADGLFVTVHAEANQILLFRSDGTIARRFGQPGDGPGEFRRIRRVLIGPENSLIVSDWGTGRLTYLDSALNVVRMMPTTILPSLALPEGRLLMAEHIMTPDRMGFPLHTVAASGEVERSFGSDTPEYAPNARLATTRLAAASPDGSIWSVPPGRYLLEHWDPVTATRLDSFELHEPEITPIEQWPTDGSRPPPGVIESIWTDSQGLLYLLLRVADPAWTSPPDPDAEIMYTPESYDATYDWIVHVLDPATHVVVARLRHGTALWGRPGSDLLTSLVTDGESGTVEFKVFEVRFDLPRR